MCMSTNMSTGMYKPKINAEVCKNKDNPALTAKGFLRKNIEEIPDENQRNLTYNLMISALNGNKNANKFLSHEEAYITELARDIYRK